MNGSYSVDIFTCRCILTEEGERKAAEFHSFLIETSAKDGLNVDTIFQKVLSMIPVEPSKEVNECDKCIVSSLLCNCRHSNHSR